MVKKFGDLSHVNSYYGRSVYKLFLYNAIHFFGFFKRRGPTRLLLTNTKKVGGSRKGKTALVLGSGPSLDLLKPSLAREYFDDIFVVNSYYKYEHAHELIPDYYALSDPNFFIDTDKVVFHDNQELYEYLSYSKSILLISHLNRNQIPAIPNEILFFDDREAPTVFGGGISPLRPRNYVSMTLYKALAMALHMEYEKIFVLGMDNSEFSSYRSSPNNQIRRESEFYFANSMKWPGMPKFSNPETLPGGIAGHLQMLAIFFGDLYKFPTDTILNLDTESLVDAFPKIANHPAVRERTVQ